MPITRVNSNDIRDLTIIDADIAADAAISDTKLATLSTSGKVNNAATTGTPFDTPNTLALRDGAGNCAFSTVTGNQSVVAGINVRGPAIEGTESISLLGSLAETPFLVTRDAVTQGVRVTGVERIDVSDTVNTGILTAVQTDTTLINAATAKFTEGAASGYVFSSDSDGNGSWSSPSSLLGTSGYSGSTGDSGYSGYSGIIGASGYSGSSASFSATINAILKSDGSGIVTSSLTDDGTTVDTQSAVSHNISVLDLTNLIPIMSGPTTPIGEASANKGPTDAWKAFDNSDITFYNDGYPIYSDPTWLRYMFASATIINSYKFMGGSWSATPNTWTFEGSNDSSSWTVLDTHTGLVLLANVYYTYSFTNSTPYLYYRLYVTKNNDGGTGAYIQINVLEMYNTNPQSVSKVKMDSGNLRLASDAQVYISSTTSAGGTPDIGIKRSASGEAQLTDGASGYGKLVLKSVQLTTDTRPAADAAHRGTMWYVAGGTGVADTIEICVKDAADAYAWVTLV